jgi:UPF0755 protein
MPEVGPVIPSRIKQQPINGQPSGLKPPKDTFRKTMFWTVTTIGAAIIGVGIAFVIWFNVQLTPLSNDGSQKISVNIESNMTPGAIGHLLQTKQVVRSGLAFEIYSRLKGLENNLQAGLYSLLPSESTNAIVEQLTKGSVETVDVTFLPGATLRQNQQVLLDLGYSATEIDTAFAKTYNSPLFDTRPVGKDLEGYIYGETYRFNSGVPLETILQRAFDEYYKVIQDNNLVAAFKAHGLTLYEGITLASIIQREVSGAEDQKKVAQVFYSRMSQGIQLGSDVTYKYIADKLGLVSDPKLDNPYNTRIYVGLPPGPISSPGLSALMAVANPASTNYLYFLAGDDGITYFSTTEAGHNANIINHCQKNCSSP